MTSRRAGLVVVGQAVDDLGEIAPEVVLELPEVPVGPRDAVGPHLSQHKPSLRVIARPIDD